MLVQSSKADRHRWILGNTNCTHLHLKKTMLKPSPAQYNTNTHTHTQAEFQWLAVSFSSGLVCLCTIRERQYSVHRLVWFQPCFSLTSSIRQIPRGVFIAVPNVSPCKPRRGSASRPSWALPEPTHSTETDTDADNTLSRCLKGRARQAQASK